MPKLQNPARERFCQEYLIDGNATKAYMRAGYQPKDAESAKSSASRLLTVDNVAARIEELVEQRNRRLQVSQDRVVKELAKLGFSDVHAIVELDDAGNMVRVRPLDDIAPEDRAAIQSLKIRTSGKGADAVTTVEVKLHPKEGPLRMLAEHTGAIKNPGQALVDALLLRSIDELDDGTETGTPAELGEKTEDENG